MQPTKFICPECGSSQFSSGCFVETIFDSNDPWSAVLQLYTCAGCGYAIPAHLGERWNGISSEKAMQEWKQTYRAAAPREPLD